MTDRYEGFVITLRNQIREDDAEATINAIKQIKGVVSVEPVIGNVDIQLAKTQARSELIDLFYKVFYPTNKE